MRDRDRRTAEEFGLLDRVEALERELLKVGHVVGVEFDLDGFYSDIFQVIVVPEYDIPANMPDYFAVRKDMLREVLAVTREHGLNPSGDGIEDYGRHFYIVRNCDESWRRAVEQHKSVLGLDLILSGAQERSCASGGFGKREAEFGTRDGISQ